MEFQSDKQKNLGFYDLSEIVDKYADHKLLSVVFAKEFDPKKLDKIGKLKEFEFPKAVISVKREVAPVAAAELLRKFPVADLNVEEVPIEDIIREVFTGKDVA